MAHEWSRFGYFLALAPSAPIIHYVTETNDILFPVDKTPLPLQRDVLLRLRCHFASPIFSINLFWKTHLRGIGNNCRICYFIEINKKLFTCYKFH
jgi:hypothetical protein